MDQSTAEAVVDELRVHGFPSHGIRIVTAPETLAAPPPAGIVVPASFEDQFERDLAAIGASKYEADSYLAAVRRGRALVYATGSEQQAAEAVEIMNEYDPQELEEFLTAGATNGVTDRSKQSSEVTGTGPLGSIHPEPRLPESQVTIGAHETSYTSHASRSKKEGARIFSW
jgi:hypothetical protein